eukprot:5092724-Pyramimonas_sp.AAC.1
MPRLQDRSSALSFVGERSSSREASLVDYILAVDIQICLGRGEAARPEKRAEFRSLRRLWARGPQRARNFS